MRPEAAPQEVLLAFGRSAAESEQTRMACSRTATDSHAGKSGSGACGASSSRKSHADPMCRWRRSWRRRRQARGLPKCLPLPGDPRSNFHRLIFLCHRDSNPVWIPVSPLELLSHRYKVHTTLLAWSTCYYLLLAGTGNMASGDRRSV